VCTTILVEEKYTKRAVDVTSVGYEYLKSAIRLVHQADGVMLIEVSPCASVERP
jgi:hypothetical protein